MKGSNIIRPEVKKTTYNQVMIASGVKEGSGLESALQQILLKYKELKEISKGIDLQ